MRPSSQNEKPWGTDFSKNLETLFLRGTLAQKSQDLMKSLGTQSKPHHLENLGPKDRLAPIYGYPR
jgi:hypothetical protein